jgi:hypothetical protein
MHALLLASFLFAGEVGYQQVTWSPPQIVFGAPGSKSTVALDKWATTVRLGDLACSLSDDKFAAAFGSSGPSNVVAERSE